MPPNDRDPVVARLPTMFAAPMEAGTYCRSYSVHSW